MPAPKRGRGRPPGDPALRRSTLLTVRVSSDEAARYEAAAAASGTTISAVARAAWERMAKRARAA